jgi:hypothetical protein
LLGAHLLKLYLGDVGNVRRKYHARCVGGAPTSAQSHSLSVPKLDRRLATTVGGGFPVKVSHWVRGEVLASASIHRQVDLRLFVLCSSVCL